MAFRPQPLKKAKIDPNAKSQEGNCNSCDSRTSKKNIPVTSKNQSETSNSNEEKVRIKILHEKIKQKINEDSRGSEKAARIIAEWVSKNSSQKKKAA